MESDAIFKKYLTAKRYTLCRTEYTTLVVLSYGAAITTFVIVRALRHRKTLKAQFFFAYCCFR
jgi:hypothetical protein